MVSQLTDVKKKKEKEKNIDKVKHATLHRDLRQNHKRSPSHYSFKSPGPISKLS